MSFYFFSFFFQGDGREFENGDSIPVNVGPIQMGFFNYN